MTKKILFSLPVHERPDIVAGQLDNIRRYCPNAATCVHISPSYDGDPAPFQALERHPGVFVNTNRLPVVHGAGLFHVHLCNFIFGLQRAGDVDVFAFLASNELFVKQGLEERTMAFQAAAQVEMGDPSTGWHAFRRGLEHDARVRALTSHLGLPTIFGGQAEGQFFEVAAFAEMARLYLRFFDLAPVGFESEELLPQTMLMALMDRGRPVSLPFTLQNYCHGFDFDERLIADIRAGRGFVFGPRVDGNLRSPHVATNDLSSVFSIKRVPREDCALRRMVYGLDSAGDTVRSAA